MDSQRTNLDTWFTMFGLAYVPRVPTTYIPEQKLITRQKDKIYYCHHFPDPQARKQQINSSSLIRTLSMSLQFDPTQTATKHARFYIMVALPDADGQDLIRNERTTKHRRAFVLEGVSNVCTTCKRKKSLVTVSSGSE